MQQPLQSSQEEPMEYPDERIFDDEATNQEPQHSQLQQRWADNIGPVIPPSVPSHSLSPCPIQEQQEQQQHQNEQQHSLQSNSEHPTIGPRQRTLMFVNLLLKHLQDSPLSLMQVKAVVSECVQRQRSQGGNLSLMLQKELKASLSHTVYIHVHELLEWHCWQRCQQASMSIAMAQNDAVEDVPQLVVSGFEEV